MKTESKTRLWGQWEPQFYGSGTTLVRLKFFEGCGKYPHLYIYADSAINETRYMQDRYEMCKQLAAFLNGANHPIWLDDFTRNTESNAKSLSGGSITATGPSYEKIKGSGNWFIDESDEAKNNRARLLDVLFSISI